MTIYQGGERISWLQMWVIHSLIPRAATSNSTNLLGSFKHHWTCLHNVIPCTCTISIGARFLLGILAIKTLAVGIAYQILTEAFTVQLKTSSLGTRTFGIVSCWDLRFGSFTSVGSSVTAVFTDGTVGILTSDTLAPSHAAFDASFITYTILFLASFS